LSLSDQFKQFGEPKDYKKGDYVFKQGERSNHLFLVKKGFLKAFYTTPEGKEFVKTFISENHLIGISSNDMLSGAFCTYSLICLEPSQLLRLHIPDLFNLIKKDSTIAFSVIDLLISVIVKKERREYEFLCLSAEERYLDIQKHWPELLKRATQIDIAGYLGITPVALSRIKNRSKLPS